MFLIKSFFLLIAMMLVVLSRESFHKSEDQETKHYMYGAAFFILLSQLL